MSIENIPSVLYPKDTWQLMFETSNPHIKWTSSNPNVCRVSPTGVLLAKSPGKTVISVDTVSCSVYVGVHVADIKIKPNVHNLNPGDQFQLTVTVVPEHATDHGVSWSSDNSCCIVSALGMVTAVNIGEANITAQSDDQNHRSTSKITVSPKSHMSFSVTDVNILVGRTYKPQCVPEATVHLNWSVGNPTIASVNKNGQIKGLAPGQTTVTASHGDLSASINVTVTPLPFRL